MKCPFLIITLAAALVLAACTQSTPPSDPQTPTGAATATQASAAQPTAEPTEAGAGQIDTAAWDALLADWIAADNLFCDAPGGVLLVDTPAGRYLKAAGATSIENERPVEAHDRFEIGSNTKAFTVILALQLQEEGVLALDDRLSTWLPDLAAQIPNGDQITLRQMASNTSGIADYADPLMQPLIDTNDQEGIARSYTPQELVAFALTTGEPAFAPGEGWQYSSTNFILLGMVVEAATDQSLADLYQERIFTPLGMANTSYLESSPEPGSIVDGYYTIADGALTSMTSWNATQGGAAGAIVSTAEDMARFANGLFDGQLFQQEATLAEMLELRELTPNEGGGLIDSYGLGVMSFATSGYATIGHAGQTPGFQSVWFYVPDASSTFVFLTSSGSCRVMFLPSNLPAEDFGLEPGEDM